MEESIGVQGVGSRISTKRQDMQLWGVGVSERMKISSLGPHLWGEREAKVKP